MPDSPTKGRRMRRLWRWRPLLAYGFISLVILLTLSNLVMDRLVSGYERNASRDPGSPFLKGMTPREMGPENSTRAVLFVHGFIGAQSNFNDLPDEVAAAGWHVRTIRLPGHGTSPHDHEQTSADAMIAGVLDEVRSLKERFATVVVVAHSLGGALATLAVAEEPVDGLILCSPFFGLSLEHEWGLPAQRMIRSASTVLRWIPGRPGFAPVNKIENRPFVDAYHWISVKGGLTALEVGERARSPEILSRIQTPVLLIHSYGDTVTSPSAAGEALSHWGSDAREFIWLEKSDHVIFWDHDEATVVESVLRYLKEVENHDPD
jgi:carboxylesterase